MKQEEIQKAFEGRWRIKAHIDGTGHVKNSVGRYVIPSGAMECVKALCRDFFETGITIGQLDNENDTYGICNGGIVREDELVVVGVSQFEDFWNLYDKKVGRPKCEKLWEKLNNAERAACIAYIPLYKQAQPEKQYRKNPETFLRNKSWNDELIYRNNGTNQPTIEQQKKDKLVDILIG